MASANVDLESDSEEERSKQASCCSIISAEGVITRFANAYVYMLTERITETDRTVVKSVRCLDALSFTVGRLSHLSVRVDFMQVITKV